MTKKWDKIFTKELLEEKYKELGEVSKIGKFFGCKRDTVSKYMKQFGLEVKRQGCKRKFDCNDNFFEELNEHVAYWGGFISADGNVWSNNLACKLSQKDVGHLEKLKKDLECEKKLIFQSKKSPFEKYKENIYHSVSFKVTSQKIVDDLKKFNIVPNKTLTYKFPEIMENSIYFKDYLRGYIDGDGSISLHNDRGTLRPKLSIVGNYDFLESVAKIIYKNINVEYSKVYTLTEHTYQLSYQKKDSVLKILHYLYDDVTICLDRKYEIVQQILKDYS